MQETVTLPPRGTWPKNVPALTPEQEAAREAWMLLWHEQLPNKYGVAEKFNHGFVAELPVAPGTRTLEIGAGIGGHIEHEDLTRQEYNVLEMRDEFCARLAELLPPGQVHQGSIEERQPFADGSFDRLIAIHVLEHLPNLPAALDEAARLLKRGGYFDVVLPCEGGLAYSFARAISSKRMFESHFHMSYDPIIRAEHVNQLWEVNQELFKRFKPVVRKHFPLVVPVDTANLFVGYRLVHASA
jgi:SAM-dependent methyltransferase